MKISSAPFALLLLLASGLLKAGPCPVNEWATLYPNLGIRFEFIEGQARVGGWYGFRKEMEADGCNPKIYPTMTASGSATESIISITVPSTTIEYSYSGKRYWDPASESIEGEFKKSGTRFKCESAYNYVPPPEVSFEEVFYSVDSRTKVVSDRERIFEFEGDVRPPCAFSASWSSSFEPPESDPVIAKGIRFSLLEEPEDLALEALEEQMANPFVIYTYDPFFGGFLPLPADFATPEQYAEAFPQPTWAPTQSPAAYSSEFYELSPPVESANPGDAANGIVSARYVRFSARIATDCEGLYEVEEYFDDSQRDPSGSCGVSGSWSRKKTVFLRPGANGQALYTGSIPTKPATLTELKRIRYRKLPNCVGVPGATLNELGSIRHQVSLGTGLRPGVPGVLYLETGTVEAAYTPEALIPVDLAEVRSSTTGGLLQVAGQEQVGDFSIDDAGFTLAIYGEESIMERPGATVDRYTFLSEAVPLKRIRYEDPDYDPAGVSPHNRLRISEYSNDAPTADRVFEYVFDPASGDWSMFDSASGEIRTRGERALGSAQRSVVETLRNTEGDILSGSERVYEDLQDGERHAERLVRVERFRDFDGDGIGVPGTAERTTYSYYTEGEAFGKLHERVSSDGGWERREYPNPEGGGSDIEIERVIRPLANNAPGSEAGENYVTEKITRPAVLGGAVGTLHARTENRAGLQVLREMSFVSEDGELETETVRRYAEPGGVEDSDWDSGPFVETVKTSFRSGEFEDKLKELRDPGGMTTRYAYERLIDLVHDGELVLRTTIESGAWDEAGGAFTAGRRITEWTGSSGAIRERQVRDIAAGDLLVEWTRYSDFDWAGRARRVDYMDGTFEMMSYDCCGLEWTVDRTGIQTFFDYFPDGSLRSTERLGIETRYEKGFLDDPLTGHSGEEKTTIRTGTDGTEMILTSEFRDRTGRLLWSLDGLGNRTRHDDGVEPGGTRVETMLLPDEMSTEVRRVSRDGELESITGTAAYPQRFEYGAAPDFHAGVSFNATFKKAIRLRRDGADTVEYRTEWRDMLGRVYKTATPAPDGSGPVYAYRYFNNLGQLTREVDPDGVARLYAYGSLGELELVALDVNANGLIDLDGPDTVMERERYFDSADDGSGGTGPALFDVNRRYENGGAVDLDSTKTFLDRQLTLYSAVDDSREERTDFYGAGDYRVRSVDAHGVARIEEYSGGYRIRSVRRSADDSVEVGETFSYDAHGRLDRVEDDRGAVIDFAYHEDDTLQRLTGPESAPGSGDRRTERFSTAWDTEDGGVVRSRELPDGSLIVRTYDPAGKMRRKYGTGLYPVDFEYDSAGRLHTLRTYGSHDPLTGEGAGAGTVTEWRYNPAGLLEEKIYDADSVNPQSGMRYSYTPGGRVSVREWVRAGSGGARIRTDYGQALSGSDSSGRLKRVHYSDGTPGAVYDYDRAGRIEAVEDGSGRREIRYRSGSDQIEAVDHVSGPWAGTRLEFSYSGSRLLSEKMIAGSGEERLETYGYDNLGRLNALGSPERSFEYAYHSGSDEIASIRYLRHGSSFLSGERTINGRRELSGLQWLRPGQSAVLEYGFTYDALGRRTLGMDDKSYWAWAYDRLGQVESAVRHRGATTNPLIDAEVPGYHFEFQHDAAGNREWTHMNGRAAEWSVNALNQYLWREVPRHVDIRGEASKNASVSVQGHTAARAEDFFWVDVDFSSEGSEALARELVVDAVIEDGDPGTIDPRHIKPAKVFLPATPETFLHDADGNLLQDGCWSYQWDAENRLVEMETLPVAVAGGRTRLKLRFGYDAGGRRVRKEVLEWNPESETYQSLLTEETLWNGWLPVRTRIVDAGVDTVRDYLWGLDITGSIGGAGGVGGLLAVDAGEQSFCPLYDGRGNVTAYLDADTQERVAEFDYGPFGELLRSTGARASEFRYRFSTKHTDPESGLLDYGYRHYNPDTGRWLSRDPIGEAGGVNLYGFVANQPINAVDRLGLDTYGIGGTYENMRLSPEERGDIQASNVWDFLRRLDDSENREYFPGPGVTERSGGTFSKPFNGANGFETYRIVQDVIEQICKDRARARKEGRDFKINLVGWSRGATAAAWVAKELQEVDCDCDGEAESLEVNFLGLYDAVEMIPSGILTPGHRLPQWLPGDQGPPNSVPSNVEHFIHAQKTGGTFIDSTIPLPTTNFGHPNERGYPLLRQEVYRTKRRTFRSYASNHGEIGISPGATGAHAAVLNEAARAGIPLLTADPYNHHQP